jgi:hypothetical protein
MPLAPPQVSLTRLSFANRLFNTHRLSLLLLISQKTEDPMLPPWTGTFAVFE